jgi:uncharacterized protein (DUF58 family)
MVRTYEEELSGRIAILLAPGENADQLDEAARIAASIGFAALDEGHHIEFVYLVSGRPELIPPFDDGQAFLDRLAALRTAETPVGAEQFRAAAEAVSRKAALHLVLCCGLDCFAASVDELESTGRKVIVHSVTEESA